MSRDHYQLSAYMDGELEGEAAQRLEERLDADPELRTLHRRYLSLRSAMQEEPEPDYHAASQALWERLEATPRRRKSSFWERNVTVPLPLAAAAMAVMLLMAGVTIFLSGRSAPASPVPLAGIDPRELDITIQINDTQARELIQWLEERQDVQQVSIELPETPRFELIGEPILVPASQARELPR